MPDKSIRLVVPIVVISGVAAAATGAELLYGHPADPPPAAATTVTPARPSPPPEPAAATLGLVRVDYRLTRLSQLASNQLAVWIEDADGGYVRTLFATSYTANGGYVRRPMSLPLWRERANWERATEAEVRSASRPAQDSGAHSLYWDGTDHQGRPVPAGTYVYRVEGNLLWENRVLFTGSITLGDTADSSTAGVEYLPDAARAEGEMIAEVRAAFLPGEPLDPATVTTFTRGS
ncbi:DUF2271 domain-containing protein [Nonomuraea sp. MG754425]|uniref:DUF2271 domain-containing protein n=1 Tax=Nonomuraea sp. MG754425 TaxID=2570319 RepID=UPI001F2C1BBF|nr:DUF2271 domain-containing protein [Nonomuraea sp. MG754425]MCF6473050.1 DUF2271 domain-containing protein [Nonomuraea sp. MG754425]